MIDIEEFENNFISHHKDVLNEKGIDVVRLYPNNVVGQYRAVEFLTKPIDVQRVALGHLKSKVIADKYNISLAVENFGRGEGETILTKSFSVKVYEYSRDNEKDLLEVIEKLAMAEAEFYST